MPRSFSVAKVNKMQGEAFMESGGRQWDVAGRELLLSDPILRTILLVFNAKQGCFLVIIVNPRKKKASKRGLKEEWRLSRTETNLKQTGA